MKTRTVLQKFFLVLGALVLSAPSHAAELLEFYQNTKMRAMGGAYTALAEDELAIFFNPAGLAGVKQKEVRFLLLDVEADSSLATNFNSLSTSITSLDLTTVNSLIGQKIYGRAQMTSSLIMPHFGLSLLLDRQMALIPRNQAYPEVTLGYQSTNGIQAGLGIAVGGGRKPAHRRRSHFRLGLALKYMWRRGGHYALSPLQLYNLAQSRVLRDLVGAYETGIGADLGAQFIFKINRNMKLLSGVSYLNAGNLHFGGRATSEQGNLTIGSAFVYSSRTGRTGVTVAYDYRHILHTADWRLKSHFGLEIKMPVLRIYGGLNQAFLTYGVGLDLWLFDIYAVSYASELGTVAHQDPTRRYLIRVGGKISI